MSLNRLVGAIVLLASAMALSGPLATAWGWGSAVSGA